MPANAFAEGMGKVGDGVFSFHADERVFVAREAIHNVHCTTICSVSHRARIVA